MPEDEVSLKQFLSKMSGEDWHVDITVPEATERRIREKFMIQKGGN
jgi:hypothetical protein